MIILGAAAMVEERILTSAAAADRAPAAAVPMNEAVFEAFYRRNARPLWGYLARITGNGAAADDLLQKSFFQFLRSPLRSSDERQLRSFLFTIATNLVRDEWRRSREVQADAMPEMITETAPAVEMRRDLQRVFADLDPRDRVLLWLAHVEGEVHAEIAARLGVEENSVKVLLFRARKRLREMLTRRGLGTTMEVTR